MPVDFFSRAGIFLEFLSVLGRNLKFICLSTTTRVFWWTCEQPWHQPAQFSRYAANYLFYFISLHIFPCIPLCIVQEDAELRTLRMKLVPRRLKEHEFWRRYFLAVKQIKQEVLEGRDSASSTNEADSGTESVNNREEKLKPCTSLVSSDFSVGKPVVDGCDCNEEKLGYGGRTWKRMRKKRRPIRTPTTQCP
jgi:BSD domain